MHRLWLIVWMLGIAMSARAQMLPPEPTLVPFTRYMGVRERMLVGFDVPGVRVGGFTLRPDLDLAGNYTDNAFAIQTPRIGAGYVSITPSATLLSNFSTGSLSVEANGEIDRFFTHTSENSETLNTSVYGTKTLGGSTQVRGILRYQQARESRESQNVFVLTDRPIRYEQETGAIGISHTFTRLLVSGSAGVTRSHFFDGVLNGQPFSQQYRNNDNFELKLRTEFAQSESLSYFAQVRRDATSYDPNRIEGFARDSKNYEILGGVRFELPVLARGEIGVGYLDSTYRDARVRSFSGLAVDATVTLFPTQLMTYTLTARRSVNDAGAPQASTNGPGALQSASYVALSGGARVDYELLRTLVLGAGVDLERDTFNGLNRRDGRVQVNATADWRFTPRLWLKARYDRADVSSNGIDRYKSFVRNRFTVGIGFRI